MTSKEIPEKEFTFKDYFVPLTTTKAIHFIIIIGIVVYANAFFNGFVWDDYPFLLNNADIRSINIPQLFSKNVFNDASFYRPLPALYNALLYGFSGDMPFLYHFIQIVLHCINASLVFLLFKKFLTKAIAFFLSLIFLVHPINVEAVAYISAANNQLFFLFGILALLLSMNTNTSRFHLSLVGGLSLLSLLSRETGLAFLFLILVYQIVYHRKKILPLFGTAALSLGLYFILRFAYAGIYYTKEITKYPIPIAQLSFIERLQNIPMILYYYFSHIFYPVHFAVAQHWIVTNKTIENFYLPLVFSTTLLFLGFAFAIFLYKTGSEYFKKYIFFSLWFISGIIFILQIVPLELTVADHWMYFPIVGLLGIIGICAEMILVNLKSKKRLSSTFKKLILVGAILVVLLLSLRTIVRISNYKDEITLYTHDSIIYSDWKLENDLGSDYARIGDMNNAYKHFKQSYDYYPTPWNMYHLGLHYQDVGDNKNALLYYTQAYNATQSKEFKSTIKSGKSSTEYNLYSRLANISLLNKDYASSLKFSKDGLKYYPNSSDLWVALAASQYLLGNQSEALSAATKAKELSPTSKNVYLYNQIRNNKELNF